MNIIIDKEYLSQAVLREVNKNGAQYGQSKNGREKRIMIEYSNGNTHKEYHVGHLRNISYGDAVSRILAANGYHSIPVSYINDFGIHVAKTLWAYLEFYKDKELPKNKGEFLARVYVRATKELEKNKIAKPLVQAMMKKIESRQGNEYELWQETRQWSIDQFAEIYKELGVNFEHTFYESDYVEEGRTTISKLIKKGILRESQGAVIADLEKYDLGVVVAVRSDGTATYLTGDIPLAEAKLKKFKPDTSIYVVDVRQALYFKQLFKILGLMGYKEEMLHLGYDFVKLPSGMMSSRSGNVITYEELKQEIVKKAIKETGARHNKWEKDKIEKAAMKIAMGAMKFEMVKVGANQEITFDTKKALEFSGYTAAYIQYTYARINSIQRKNNIANTRINTNAANREYVNLKEVKEQELIIKLAKYPEAVARAGKEYDPSDIAKYLFELAREFNDYYHSVNILKAEEEVKKARLVLITAINQVIKNGLGLLGIEVLEEM